jgi:hypothetical protein
MLNIVRHSRNVNQADNGVSFHSLGWTKKGKYLCQPQVLVRVWQSWNPYAFLVQYGRYTKAKRRVATWFSNSTPGCMLQRVEHSDSNRYLYNVYCSTIHSSQKVETTQTSIIDEWIYAHIHTPPPTHMVQRGWTLKKYTKWNKADIKGQILNDSSYMSYLE